MRKTLRASKFLSFLGMAVAIGLAMQPSVLAQETTGGIEAYVKDQSGGAVAKAAVELSGPSLLAPRQLEADEAGYVHFAQVPPGEYKLTVTAPNFRTYQVTGIMLQVGKLPKFDVALEVGDVAQTIEVIAHPIQVDVTSSKAAVAISQDIIENIPKGRSYQSLIPFAPGARQEPLQSSRVDRFRANGFQIDGASDSENTYLVEGLDTTNIQSGGVKQNVVFEFIEQVQVKTSGFEAEHGGAMGGVVNVIQKRGGNDWHGSFLSYYRNNSFDANDQCATTPQPVVSESVLPALQQRQCGLRANPATATNPTIRLDQAAEFYRQSIDNYSVIEPGYTLGGPIFKDKLWLFSGYIPTLEKFSRTVNFSGATNPGPRTFYRTFVSQNMLNRLDYQPYNKLRLFGSWQYGYSRITGQLPTLPDSVAGQTNSIAGSDPTQFRSDTGSVNPSNIFNFGGDWTPNSRLVVGARYGYFYYNSSDRGKPTGTRWVFQQDLVAGGGSGATLGIGGSPLIASSSDANAQYAHLNGFSNIANNLQTIFDKFSRKSFSTDLSYFVSKWGTHNFKIGYGFNLLSNDVVNSYNTAQVLLFWGQAYTPKSNAGTTACTSIIGQNGTTFGTPVQAATAGCRGNTGYFIVQDGITTTGAASSYNHGLYFQDSWTVGHGLTLNLGVRFDKEFVPPYKPGASSISFGFTDKVAPRIGGAYDLFQNGKVKIFASYGKFFDIMKYSLARGSFGGEYWHDCVYALDSVNFTTITPANPGSHSCGPGLGPAPGVNTSPGSGIRFIENYDWRASVINTADPGVDPHIKPMSQHEFVVGTDWAITPRLGLEVRYARKRLDQAIEDFAVTDGTGFYIGNPGPSTYMDLLHRASTNASTAAPLPIQCATCPEQPKAIRRYDGLETRLTWRKAAFFGQLSYTYSRLTGNYSGLTDTDVTDASGGRHNPNNHREFDAPELQYTTTGKLVDGPLGTDRPHVLTLTGYYPLKWLGMETTIGAIQTVASGTPKSTCIPVVGTTSSCQFWDQRGTFAQMHRDPATGNIVLDDVIPGARMPVYSQTDFNLGHSFRVSKTNEAMRLGFEWNILNVFNQGSVLAVSPTPWANPANNVVVTPRTTANTLGVDFLSMMNGWDPIRAANAQGFGVTSPLIFSNQYGVPYLFQNRRSMRMAIKFTF
jgi:hypothetical protein